MGVVEPGDARALDLIRRGRELRKEAGIPIGAMADQCGVTKSTISVWERDPPADLGRLPRYRDPARRWLAILAVLDATAPASFPVAKQKPGPRGIVNPAGPVPG